MNNYNFVKGNFYTKYYKSGYKLIFKYYGKSTDNDMIKVSMFCGDDGEEYGENTEVTISNLGTGEGSYIEKSTQEDIDFLISTSKKYA